MGMVPGRGRFAKDEKGKIHLPGFGTGTGFTIPTVFVPRLGEGLNRKTWIFHMCKICAEIHHKNLPKGRNFTCLEDPGIPRTQMTLVLIGKGFVLGG